MSEWGSSNGLFFTRLGTKGSVTFPIFEGVSVYVLIVVTGGFAVAEFGLLATYGFSWRGLLFINFDRKRSFLII